MDRGAWWDAVPGVTELDATEHIHTNTNYRSSIKVCVGNIKKKKKKRMVQALRKNTIFIIRNTSGINGL